MSPPHYKKELALATLSIALNIIQATQPYGAAHMIAQSFTDEL